MDNSHVIKAIKDRLSLSAIVGEVVRLRGKSPNFLGLCPFHQEKTPSFHVRDHAARFKCFGCGASGDHFEFLMRARGIGFSEALLELADRASISLLTSRVEKKPPVDLDVLGAQRVAHDFFKEALLSAEGARARTYLVEERGLNEKMIKEAGLGFGGLSRETFFSRLKKHGVTEGLAIKAGLVKEGASLFSPFSSRIIFPIKNARGDVVAFAGRSFLGTDGPKYINTHSYQHYEKRKNFYGLFESKAAIVKGATPFLVEGYFDAMALWAIGVPALALCGTAMSPIHVAQLERLSNRLVIAFDRDNAGINAVKSTLIELFQANITAQIVIVDEKDPGTFLAKKTLARLKEQIANPTDALCFVIDHAAAAASGIDQRIRQIDSLLAIFARIKRPLVRRQYVAYLASRLHEDPTLLWNEIDKRLKNVVVKKDPIQVAPATLEPNERLLWEIIFADPTLIAEMTPIWPFISEAMRAMLEESARLISFDDEKFKQLITTMNQNLWPAISAVKDRGIKLTVEEAGVSLVALKDQLERSVLRKKLSEKRRELARLEKSGDFSSLLIGLKEKSAMLSAGKKPRPQQNPAPTPEPRALPKEIKELENHDDIFVPEDWY